MILAEQRGVKSERGIVDLLIFGRGGTESGFMIVYRQNGRLITPFERKIRKWPCLHLSFALRFIYGFNKDGRNILHELVYKNNPMYRLAK